MHNYIYSIELLKQEQHKQTVGLNYILLSALRGEERRSAVVKVKKRIDSLISSIDTLDFLEKKSIFTE